MEKLVRSRLVRLSFAFVLIGTGLWAFLPYVAYRVATSAFVNAELIRVTTPISGEVARNLPSKGTLVDGTATIRLVEAQRPDRRAVVTQEQQYAVADAQVALAAAQLDEVIAADRRLSQQTARHRAAVLERLARESDVISANWAACRAEEHQQEKTRVRVEALATTGVVTKQRVDDVEGAHASTGARCQATSAQSQ